MQINLNGRAFSIGQAVNQLTDFESRVVQIIQDWQSGKQAFDFKTSGSTGESKTITISRDILEYSANSTLDRLDPDRKFQSSLICINPHFIGGFMAVVRALIGNHQISFIEPEANPLLKTEGYSFDLVSMVPLQVETILNQTPELMEQVNTIIIGGAAVNQSTLELIESNTQTRFFHSYGMTETASHFALKDLKTQDHFEVLGDARIDTEENGCLNVSGTVTGKALYQTSDIVELIDPIHFNWIGRADDIINSGGVKVNPVDVEAHLQNQLAIPYFVTGIPDDKLGSKVILIVESEDALDLSNFDFSGLGKYEKPKAVFSIPKMIYTATDKINRGETLKLIQP